MAEVHLYPKLLKKLYHREIPQPLTQSFKGAQARKIVPDNTISKFIDSLSFYFQNPDLVNQDLLELKIKELVLLLLQTQNAESVYQLITELTTPQSTNLRKVVELHLYENLTLEELAKLSNLSVTSFKRQFREVFNDSPINYINLRKVEEAKELLTLSSLSIGEISYKVGIQDPQYFTRLFKSKVGETPTAYRKRNR